MTIIDRKTIRVLVTALLFGICLGFFWLAWRTILTFLFAILFAYLWEPVIPRLERRLHITRAKAVAIVYIGMVVGLGIFLLFVSPSLARQVEHLATIAPQLEHNVSNGQIAHQIGNARGWSWDTQQAIQQYLARHQPQIDNIERRVLGELAIIAGYLPWIVLVPILAIFFMLHGAEMQQTLLRQIALHQRGMAAGLLSDIHQVLASYIRGQIVLTGIAMVVYMAGFLIMRVPYPFALGAWAGLLEFIPLIGPLTAAVSVLGIAFIFNYSHLLLLLIFLGIWRVIQDYVNSPRIMGGQMQLAPLAVLFGVLAGGEIAGIIGVYLSVPAMASLRVIWLRWRAYRRQEQRPLRGD